MQYVFNGILWLPIQVAAAPRPRQVEEWSKEFKGLWAIANEMLNPDGGIKCGPIPVKVDPSLAEGEWYMKSGNRTVYQSDSIPLDVWEELKDRLGMEYRPVPNIEAINECDADTAVSEVMKAAGAIEADGGYSFPVTPA